MNKLKQNRSYKKKCSLKTRIVSIFLTICFMLLSGCSISGAANYVPSVSSDEKDSRPLVVTTIFPYYDFVRQIAGNRVRLKMVVPAGMDSHSFEPTPADMITMQQADLMVCNGGEMEQWVEKVTASLDTENMMILTMMDYVDVLEKELVEGMEDAEHVHSHSDHDHEAHDDHDHEEHVYEEHAHLEDEADHAEIHDEKKTHENLSHDTFDEHDGHEMEIEYDEHIWTSPANAMKIVEVIAEKLADISPENASYFEQNKNNYLKELKNLDDEFKDIVANGRHHMIVVADKFPLRYFAQEYGLSYRAAFSGCSTDTEPSAKTIAYLIDRIKENQLQAVFYLELSSHRTADIISEETGAKTLLFHSCHNVTRRQFDEGVTYLQLMKQNAKNLQEALS